MEYGLILIIAIGVISLIYATIAYKTDKVYALKIHKENLTSLSVEQLKKRFKQYAAYLILIFVFHLISIYYNSRPSHIKTSLISLIFFIYMFSLELLLIRRILKQKEQEERLKE